LVLFAFIGRNLILGFLDYLVHPRKPEACPLRAASAANSRTLLSRATKRKFGLVLHDYMGHSTPAFWVDSLIGSLTRKTGAFGLRAENPHIPPVIEPDSLQIAKLSQLVLQNVEARRSSYRGQFPEMN
jgi:hypothetical protein